MCIQITIYLALPGFGASAWRVAPGDWFIDWSEEKRKENLHLVINNARFLILPWVYSKNLASKILGMVSRRIADDWQKQHNYRPVLLETFVEKQRFQDTCYKAANWKNVGTRKKIDLMMQTCLRKIFSCILYRKIFDPSSVDFPLSLTGFSECLLLW